LIHGGQLVYIDQQMVVAGIRLVYSRRRHPHPSQAELDSDRVSHQITILG
jgi:hypothetical protein